MEPSSNGAKGSISNGDDRCVVGSSGHVAPPDGLETRGSTHATDIELAGQTGRRATVPLSPSHPRRARHSLRGSPARSLPFDSAR